MSGATLLAAISGAPGLLAATLSNSSNLVSCSASIQNNGDHVFGDGAGGAATEDWVTPSETTVAAFYEVRVDVNSGSFTTGTTATWLACSSTNTWTKTGAGTVNFDMSFRYVSGATLKTHAGMIMVVT